MTATLYDPYERKNGPTLWWPRADSAGTCSSNAAKGPGIVALSLSSELKPSFLIRRKQSCPALATELVEIVQEA